MGLEFVEDALVVQGLDDNYPQGQVLLMEDKKNHHILKVDFDVSTSELQCKQVISNEQLVGCGSCEMFE